MFKPPKQRIDAYLNMEEYVWFVKFCQTNYCKNASAGISLLIERQKDYQKIINQMKQRQELEKLELMKKAEVVKK